MIKTFTIWVWVYNSRGARMFYGRRVFSQPRSLALQQGIIHSVTTRVSRAFQDVHSAADKLHVFPIRDQIGYMQSCSLWFTQEKYRRVCRPWKPRPGLEEFGRLGLETIHEGLWKVEGCEKPAEFRYHKLLVQPELASGWDLPAGGGVQV